MAQEHWERLATILGCGVAGAAAAHATGSDKGVGVALGLAAGMVSQLPGSPVERRQMAAVASPVAALLTLWVADEG
jgi:hypothetical protein